MMMVLMVSVALLVFGDLAEAGEETPSTQEQLNVVLISLDTVRPDHLSCYGYHRKTSPNIDRIARQGVVFTNAFCQSGWTVLSHLSIFSSRYPRRHWFRRKDVTGPDPSIETLTAILKDHGYRTAACMDLRNDPRSSSGKMRASSAFRAFELALLKNRRRPVPQEIFRWLTEHKDEPFFLFLHYADAHDPHVLPIEFNTKLFAPKYRGGFSQHVSGSNACRVHCF